MRDERADRGRGADVTTVRRRAWREKGMRHTEVLVDRLPYARAVGVQRRWTRRCPRAAS
ncbi:hypothetical protein ACWET9_28045 [Streptomyces sp. NPDC004059]